jgi:hypothetical protein
MPTSSGAWISDRGQVVDLAAVRNRGGDEARRLDGDRIGFDAWLLPPEAPVKYEAFIRQVSAAMGPILLVAAIVASLKLLS